MRRLPQKDKSLGCLPRWIQNQRPSLPSALKQCCCCRDESRADPATTAYGPVRVPPSPAIPAFACALESSIRRKVETSAAAEKRQSTDSPSGHHPFARGREVIERADIADGEALRLNIHGGTAKEINVRAVPIGDHVKFASRHRRMQPSHVFTGLFRVEHDIGCGLESNIPQLWCSENS